MIDYTTLEPDRDNQMLALQIQTLDTAKETSEEQSENLEHQDEVCDTRGHSPELLRPENQDLEHQDQVLDTQVQCLEH